MGPQGAPAFRVVERAAGEAVRATAREAAKEWAVAPVHSQSTSRDPRGCQRREAASPLARDVPAPPPGLLPFAWLGPPPRRTILASVALERAALVRRCDGDPSGFLEISAPDVVYFDPFISRRLDGWEALHAYYESIRGKASAARFELINPLVQSVGDAAILTFHFVSWGGNENELRWNCTEVYQRTADGWRIFQTHRSFTGSGLPAAS
ncbi:MAG: YybH family protein [Hyphomicrobiales bacterium]